MSIIALIGLFSHFETIKLFITMSFSHHTNYLAPEVEVLYICVEEGFIASEGFVVGEWEEEEDDFGGDAY